LSRQNYVKFGKADKAYMKNTPQSYVFFYILLFFSSPGPEDGQARSSASHFFLLTTIFISVSILGKEDIKSRKWDQEFL
jgi:hypothetical protein